MAADKKAEIKELSLQGFFKEIQVKIPLFKNVFFIKLVF